MNLHIIIKNLGNELLKELIKDNHFLVTTNKRRTFLFITSHSTSRATLKLDLSARTDQAHSKGNRKNNNSVRLYKPRIAQCLLLNQIIHVRAETTNKNISGNFTRNMKKINLSVKCCTYRSGLEQKLMNYLDLNLQLPWPKKLGEKQDKAKSKLDKQHRIKIRKLSKYYKLSIVEDGKIYIYNIYLRKTSYLG